MEENRPGEYLPVEENERGTYIFNSKDLCMIEHIPDIVDAGIDSLKVEGRMKTALYVATVARAYRQALDDFFESKELYEKNVSHYREEVAKCTNRKFTTAFFYGKPTDEAQIYDSNTYVTEYTYLGIIEEVDGNGRGVITQRNKFSVGEEIEVMKPDGRNVTAVVKGLWNEDGEAVESCPHPKERIFVDLGVETGKFDLLRRKELTT
jgi:putative protease